MMALRQCRLPFELNFKGKVFKGKVIGCGDFFVSQALDNNHLNIFISVRGAGKKNLDLTTTYKTFSLPNDDLMARISVMDRAVGYYYCDDVVLHEPQLVSMWNAVSGDLKIAVSNVEDSIYQEPYYITVILENILFENAENGNQRFIPGLVIEDVFVGWFPG